MDADRHDFLINAPKSSILRVWVRDHTRKLRRRMSSVNLPDSTQCLGAFFICSEWDWRAWLGTQGFSFPENDRVNPGSQLTSDIETMILPVEKLSKQHSPRHHPRYRRKAQIPARQTCSPISEELCWLVSFSKVTFCPYSLKTQASVQQPWST